MLLQTVARLLFSAIQGISVVIALYIYNMLFITWGDDHPLKNG
jgi:hypothetical protein